MPEGSVLQAAVTGAGRRAGDFADLPPPAELAAERFEWTLRRLADDLTYGADASRFVGAGTDFAQSRPYQPGDSVRAIDWRVSARTGRVHVKEFEATKRTALYVVVDASASMTASSTRLSKLDAAVWMASVLALVSLRRRSPAAVLACAAGVLSTPEPPTLHRDRVLRRIEGLRRMGVGERALESDLTAAVEWIDAVAARTAMVCLLSDFAVEWSGLHGPLARLAARHDVVAMQVRDPAEDEGIRAGFVRAAEAETGAAFMPTRRRAGAEARPAALECTRAGVSHRVFRTTEPLIPALRALLSPRGGRSGGGGGR